MTDILVQTIFGWPGIIATILFSIAGLVWKHYWPILISAALFFPFSLYLSGAPAIRGLGLFLPLFPLGAALAVRARKFPTGLGTDVAHFHHQRLASLSGCNTIGFGEGACQQTLNRCAL